MYFDEPLTGLDPLGIRRMKDTIRRLSREGAAFILSSHLLSLLEEVCTHVLIMKKGERIAVGTLPEVVAQFSNGETGVSLEEVSSARPAIRRTEPHAPAPRPALPALPQRAQSARRPPAPVEAAEVPPRRGGGTRLLLVFLFAPCSPHRFGRPRPALNLAFGEGRAEVIAAIVLSAFVLFIWVLPGDQPGLAFTEAEVAFLFPAPLTRRQLIHYKLLDGLVMALFGALFFTLLSAGCATAGWGRCATSGHGGSLNANISLHQTAAALTIAWLARHGVDRALRRVLLLAGAASCSSG